jgi:Uroporphyrinogen-III synthase
LQNFDKRSGNLLYVSGEIISSNLDKDLISEGYIVKRIINYSVLPTEEISEEFINELKSSIPDMVYVYSENSARNYLNLLKKYNLLDYWMNTNLMCLGEKTSSVLNEIKWKKIFLFNSGEEEFLLYKI